MFTVRLENIKIRQDLSNDEVAKIAYAKFNIPQESVTDYKIVKKSIDARDKNDIFYNYFSLSVTMIVSFLFLYPFLTTNTSNNTRSAAMTRSITIIMISHADIPEFKLSPS